VWTKRVKFAFVKKRIIAALSRLLVQELAEHVKAYVKAYMRGAA
jgi:hypothetical protein